MSPTVCLEDITPRPFGILGVNDRCARRLVNEAEAQRLRIPDDVAVMGIDDASMHTEQGAGITSVSTPGFDVGLRLGHVMADWLAGQPPPRTTLVPFREINHSFIDRFVRWLSAGHQQRTPRTPATGL